MLGLGFDFIGEQLLLMLQSLANEKYLGHGCVVCVTPAVQSASLRAKSRAGLSRLHLLRVGKLLRGELSLCESWYDRPVVVGSVGCCLSSLYVVPVC